MSENDFVTRAELKAHCKDKQADCQRFSEERLKNLLGEAVKAVLADKTLMVIPRPVFYLLATSLVAAGAAGRDIGSLIKAAF